MVPSSFLVPIKSSYLLDSKNLTTIISGALTRLDVFLDPRQAPSDDDSGEDGDEDGDPVLDEFEHRYAVAWLTRVIGVLGGLSREQEEEEGTGQGDIDYKGSEETNRDMGEGLIKDSISRETERSSEETTNNLLDLACQLLAKLSGESATGQATQFFSFILLLPSKELEVPPPCSLGAMSPLTFEFLVDPSLPTDTRTTTPSSLLSPNIPSPFSRLSTPSTTLTSKKPSFDSLRPFKLDTTSQSPSKPVDPINLSNALSHTFSSSPIPSSPIPPTKTNSTSKTDAYPSISQSKIPIRINLRSITLTDDAIGSRTWGSAPLLAKKISEHPGEFWPELCSPLASNIPEELDAVSTCISRVTSDLDVGDNFSRLGSTLFEGKGRRVLELGSGTGLVGLVAGKVLDELQRRRWNVINLSSEEKKNEVFLTDYHPLVIDNLKHNAESNGFLRGISGFDDGNGGDDGDDEMQTQGVDLKVKRLDWRTCLSRTHPDFIDSPTPQFFHNNTLSLPMNHQTKEGSDHGNNDGIFDTIVGADLIYEVSHVEWVKAVLERYLRFPYNMAELPSGTSQAGDKEVEELGNGEDDNVPNSTYLPSPRATPAIHLVIPLRPTHTKEVQAFEDAFSANPKQSPKQPSSITPPGWALQIVRTEEMEGDDGFGNWSGGGIRTSRMNANRAGNGEVEGKPHRYYRIEWRRDSEVGAV